MPFWRDQLEFKACTIVANTETTFPGVRKFYERLVEDPLSAAQYSLGKNVVMLTGSHGSPDGNDGLTDLLMLTSQTQDSKRNCNPLLDPTQTRGFYAEWYTKYFGQDPEDEDPRIYNDKTGKVTEIKKICQPSDWKTMTKRIQHREVEFKVIFAEIGLPFSAKDFS